jgi:hypothetical protein
MAALGPGKVEVHDVDTGELRKRLKDHGAYLPNHED